MGKASLRAKLLLAAGLAAICVPEQAVCQRGARIEVDLGEQTLDEALRSVGRQSGREIIYPAAVVAGRRISRVSGVMTGDEAISLLLRGTGLRAEFRNDIVVIRDPDAPHRADANEGEEAGTVVVTGSRIRGATAIGPTRTITRERATAEGLTDLGQVARSLAQNFNGGQNPGVVGTPQGSENVTSSTALNLRGLGQDATLTLLNGHRLAYDAVTQGVDISAIPLLAVERLEVVTDGASALYGSDAVGGVANIVLRRDYDGMLASARIATTLEGGGQADQLGLLAGRVWSTGGFMAALDYSHTTAINAGQRVFARSLDPSATLLPGQKQYSGVIAGHQELGSGWNVSLDTQFTRRTAIVSTPFLSPGDVRTAGSITSRRVGSYSVSPSVEGAIGTWRIKLGGTLGESLTNATLSLFSGGVPLVRNRVRYENELRTAEASAEGPLVALPAGDARLAIGAGVRHVSLDGSILSTAGTITRTTLSVSRAQDVKYGFVEASIPLVAPGQSIGFVNRLVLNAAARFEHYEVEGDVVTPKLGVRYDPIVGLSLRASWGRSFKAPTLSQETQDTRGLLLPATYFRPGAPAVGPVLLLAGGGRGLSPEKATTWTAGFRLGADGTEGAAFEANVFQVRYRDRVLAPIIDNTGSFRGAYASLVTLAPAAAQVAALVRDLPQGLINQTGAGFNPATVVAIVDNRLANVARQDARGVDAQFTYEASGRGGSRIGIVAAVTYLESEQQFVAGQPSIQRAGTIFDPPHWRGRVGVSWTHGPLQLAGVASYIGENVDDRFSPSYDVDSYASLDLTARLARLTERGPLAGVDVLLSATNLTGERPGRIRTTDPASTPFDSTNHPSTGRVVSLTLTKRW